MQKRAQRTSRKPGRSSTAGAAALRQLRRQCRCSAENKLDISSAGCGFVQGVACTAVEM